MNLILSADDTDDFEICLLKLLKHVQRLKPILDKLCTTHVQLFVQHAESRQYCALGRMETNHWRTRMKIKDGAQIPPSRPAVHSRENRLSRGHFPLPVRLLFDDLSQERYYHHQRLSCRLLGNESSIFFFVNRLLPWACTGKVIYWLEPCETPWMFRR